MPLPRNCNLGVFRGYDGAGQSATEFNAISAPDAFAALTGRPLVRLGAPKLCQTAKPHCPFFPRAGSPRSQMWRGWKPHPPFFRGLEARAPRRRARSGVCAICGQLPSTVKRTSRETCDELRARQRDRRCRGRDFTCDSAVPLHGQVLAPPRFPRFDLISSACCGRIRGRCTEGWRSGRSRRS